MPNKVFEINLDIKNPDYKLVPLIEVVSGDTDTNVFNIQLFENYVPVNATGNTAVITFVKPDGTIVYQNLTVVNATIGKYTCTLSSQTIIVPGQVKSEVSLYQGTKRLTSTRFELIVRKALLDENTVESSNEFSALTEALNELEQYDERIIDIKNSIQNPAPPIPASLSTAAPVASVDLPVNSDVEFEFEAPPLLVNIPGRDGDFEIDSNSDGLADGWNKIGTVTTQLSSDYKIGIKAQLLSSPSVATGIYKPIKLINTHKYYITTQVKRTAQSGTTLLWQYRTIKNGTVEGALIQIATLFNISSDDSAPLNTWYKTSNVFIATGEEENLYIRRSGNTGEFTCIIDGSMVVDLTAIFGAGNEPNQAWCDANVSYVNGIQPMMGLYIEGSIKNLFDKSKAKLGGAYNNIGAWVAYADTFSTDFIPIKPNADYVQNRGVNCYIDFWDKDYKFISGLSAQTRKSPSNAMYITAHGLIAAIDYFQLEEGITPTPYEPHKGSGLLLEGAFGGIGSYRDKVWGRAGKVGVLWKKKKYVLKAADISSLSTAGTNADFASINLSVLVGAVVGNPNLIENMAIISGFYKEIVLADRDNISGVGGFLYGSVAINLVFAKGTYANLAAAQAALAGTEIWYVLASPVEEIMPTPINGLMGWAGKTTYSLRTGVVKEKANISVNASQTIYYMNAVGVSNVPDSKQSRKVKKFLDIFKNGVSDIANWVISTDYAYGAERAAIVSTKYDPTATYNPLYEALPEENNNQQVAVTLQLKGNLLDSHNATVEANSEAQNKIGSIQADITDHKNNTVDAHGINLKANIVQSNWIDATLQNGWTGTLKYRKNTIGQIEFQASITPGTLTAGALIAQLPAGYNSVPNTAIPCIKMSDGTTVLGFTLSWDGKITIRMAQITTGSIYAFGIVVPYLG